MMKKQNIKNKKHLGNDLTIASILFLIGMCLLLGFFSFKTYYDSVTEEYRRYISGILNFMSDNIDGDDLQQCIETKQESEAYADSQVLMNKIKDNYDIEYIYIIEPLNVSAENNTMYVMSGISQEEQDDSDNVYLGDLSGDEYDEALARHYMAAMNTDDITYYGNKSIFGYMYSGILPIKNSQNESIALLCVDVPVMEIGADLIKFIQVFAWAAAVSVVIFFATFVLWTKKRILSPIEKLEASAEAFIVSSHTAEEPSKIEIVGTGINSKDEMESLSQAFFVMAQDIKCYMAEMIEKTKEKERIASELSVATRIQASMLPSISPKYANRPEFDIYASMEPAKEVGGDFYDFFMVDETHLALVAADVSGKGVPASLFMVIGKTLLKDYTGFGYSLGDVFTKVNQLLCESNKENLFITAFEGVLDLTTGVLEFANAGHELPIIYHSNEDKWEVYPTKPAFVLAGLEGMKYTSATLDLKAGDRLFLYTDGIPEALNPQDQQYGMDRLVEALGHNSKAQLQDLVKNVRADVAKFVDGAEQFDDITMLCVEYKQGQQSANQ